MEDAIYESLSIEANIGGYVFKATGSKQVFDGYTRVYNFFDREDKILPHLNVGDAIKVDEIDPKQHFTKPPARYTERSEEHTSELQSRQYLVCRLLLEKKKKN